MSKIFWDTNLFIYFFESKGSSGQRTRSLMERMDERGDQLCTSTMTVGELLVKPRSLGRLDLVRSYESVLASPAVQLVSFDLTCARIYSQVRGDKAIKAPDAIQLACAASAKCDMFITNDDRLSRKVVSGIQFIVSLEQAFL